jgi:ParB/RepB/Spo0J family partition protein
MATKTKKPQGNGLAALLTPQEPPAEVVTDSIYAAKFLELSTYQILIRENFRKTFDEAALNELSESIKQHGILQPLVVRPGPGDEGFYELVAGERRFRAAQLAGFEWVPVMVRHLDDKQFYEVQILENLQRRDVHPLEEALGFKRLLQHGFSEEEIADKLGKTRTFIAQRLRLNNLNKNWTEHLKAGKLALGAALLLARLDKANQDKVLKETEHFGRSLVDAFWSSKVIQDAINRYVYLDLAATIFPKDDAELNPARGACLTCAKRTGYNKTLFAEINEKDYCLDSTCFQLKKDRFVAQQKQRLESQGENFLTVSSQWYLPDASKDIVTSGSYDLVQPDQVTDQCKKAIIIDGDNAGKEVMVKLRGRTEVLETTEQKEQARLERLATIRENKIKAKVKQLTAESIYVQLSFPDGLRETMAFFLNKKLSYGTVSKDTKALLSDQYGFGEYYDSAYNAKKTWMSEGIARLTTERMLQLYFHYDLIRHASSEYDSTIIELSSKVLTLIQRDEIQEQATSMVDKTKGKKKGVAT